MPLEPGVRLGPYEILAALGAGGMGEVYRARDTRLDRTVAIKVLLPHLSSNEAVRQRFEREAKSISQLSHPHICALYDVGREDDTSYLVMEFLEGRNLGDRLTEGPLRPDETLKYGAQIAEALAAAHRQGLIHRDLKPANVVLTPSGAKLLDFGLAKALPEGSGTSTDLTSSLTMATPLTTAGTLVGTFQYMSPEQLEGQEADARSDVFAFGATLYEMATGQKSFDGKTQASVIAAVLEKEPPAVSSIQPLTPPALSQLVTQCLRKNPQERRQSMHDIALELKWMQDAGSQAGVPAPVRTRRRSRERLAWTAAVVSSLVAIALAALLLTGLLGRRTGSEATSPLHAQLVPPEGRILSFTSRHPGPPTLSPDGRYLAFATRDASTDAPPTLGIQDLESGTVRALPDSRGAGYPFWSPDGNRLGYFAEGALFVLDVAEQRRVRICDAPNGKGGSWGSDDVIVFAPEAIGPLVAIPASGGEPRAVTTVDTMRYSGHRFPVRLPGTDSFVYIARPRPSDVETPNDVLIGSLSNDAPVRLELDATSQVTYVDGSIYYARELSLFARRFDVGSAAFIGEERLVLDDVATIEGADFGVFTVAANRIVFGTGSTDDGVRTLVWFDRRGRSLGELGEPGRYDRPRVSPDGKSVSVEIDDANTGTRDLWILDAARGLPTRFTFDPSSDEFAVWSPDSKQIAFSSDRSGSWAIYVKSVAGGEARLVAEMPGRNVPTAWSRDGKYLAVTAKGDNWIVPLDSNEEPRRFASTDAFTEWGGVFSPDGKWFGFVSNESGTAELYVTSFPTAGRKFRISARGGQGARWPSVGSELVYVTEKSEIYRVPVGSRSGDIEVGEEELLFSEPSAREGDIAADGQTLLLLLAPNAAKRPPLQLIDRFEGSAATK
ncbi:MAG: serine/threonine-protein kinase [Candidatus Eisenbacteria bacterium]|nr:serine/threonine-protein kinase [Candidatus Eisenbacteria bacterium]